MKKEDVQFHSDGFGLGNPAINVKVHRHLDWADRTEKHFKCSPEVAQRAANWAWDAACRSFWDGWQSEGSYGRIDIVEMFGASAKVYAEGRSEGWFTVHGLPDIEDWDAVMLAKWAKLCRMIREEVEGACEWESARETIEANRWAEENAEEYNFVDVVKDVADPDAPPCAICGPVEDCPHSSVVPTVKKTVTVCLADVPRCLHCGR